MKQLQSHAPEAYAWWAKNTPHLFFPWAVFLFPSEGCEPIDAGKSENGLLRVVFNRFLLAYGLFILLADFLPRYGPPSFRYTGSNPATAVWNFGWPAAIFIRDPWLGWHSAPGVELIIVAQLAIAVTFILSQLMARHRANRFYRE